MQPRIQLRNNSSLWNAKRRYRVGDVVEYKNSFYVNATGTNTEPGTDEVWRFVSTVGIKAELPEFMFLSGSNNFSVDGTIPYNDTMEYLTDEMRELDITQFIDFPIWSIPEVERWNDTILFLIREQNTEYTYHLLALRGCILINNVLTVESSEHVALDVPLNTALEATTVHSSVTNRGYFYCATRPTDTAIPPTRFTRMWKFNVENLEDSKYIDFDSAVNTQYRGNTTDIQQYKDNIYAFFVQSSSRGGSLIRVNEDFKTFETMFTVGSSALEPTKVLRVDAPYVIYNNEVYFMTNDTTASSTVQRNTIGVRVMGFDGIEKRYASVSIATAFTPNNPATAHWMSVHNNKLIVHTGATTGSNNYKLLRIDCTSLVIEEVYDLPHRFTDDNTIMPNGLVYLNGESSGNDKRYTVKYNDFSTFAFLSDSVGASIKNPVTRDEQLYKLSQFKNDLTIGATNLSYTASPTNGVVASDTGTDATLTLADTTNAGLLSPADKVKLNATTGTNSGDNAANTTSNAYADGKVANDLTASTTVAPSKTAVNTALAPKANDSAVVHNTGNETVAGEKTFSNNILQAQGSSIQNASNSNRGRITLGTTSTATDLMRNVADDIEAGSATNSHTSSTGDIFGHYSNVGGTTAKRAGVRKDGRTYGSDATASNDYYTKSQFDSFQIVNTGINTAQTATTLNAAYPSAPVMMRVYAPNVGTGMIYVKTTSGGQWMAQSCTVLNP